MKNKAGSWKISKKKEGEKKTTNWKKAN